MKYAVVVYAILSLIVMVMHMIALWYERHIAIDTNCYSFCRDAMEWINYIWIVATAGILAWLIAATLIEMW